MTEPHGLPHVARIGFGTGFLLARFGRVHVEHMPSAEYPDLESRNSTVQLALLQQQVATIACDILEVKTKLDRTFVTRAEFEPIRNLVYGAVGLILAAVLTALIALVVTRGLP
jgi:hypothetical protein